MTNLLVAPELSPLHWQQPQDLTTLIGIPTPTNCIMFQMLKKKKTLHHVSNVENKKKTFNRRQSATKFTSNKLFSLPCIMRLHHTIVACCFVSAFIYDLVKKSLRSELNLE